MINRRAFLKLSAAISLLAYPLRALGMSQSRMAAWRWTETYEVSGCTPKPIDVTGQPTPAHLLKGTVTNQTHFKADPDGSCPRCHVYLNGVDVNNRANECRAGDDGWVRMFDEGFPLVKRIADGRVFRGIVNTEGYVDWDNVPQSILYGNSVATFISEHIHFGKVEVIRG